MKSLAITWVNTKRFLRERSNVFFVFVFPLLIVLLIGVAFGGSFDSRIGVVVEGEAGPRSTELIAAVDAVDDLITEPFDDAGMDAQCIKQAPDGAIWMGGVNGLVRWELEGRWELVKDLPPPRLFDRRGGLWCGDSERVLRYADGGWEELSGCSTPLTLDAEGTMWMRCGTGVARWNDGELTSFGVDPEGIEEVLEKVAEQAARRGRPFLVHLPMEPYDYPEQNPGPGAILIGSQL